MVELCSYTCNIFSNLCHIMVKKKSNIESQENDCQFSWHKIYPKFLIKDYTDSESDFISSLPSTNCIFTIKN